VENQGDGKDQGFPGRSLFALEEGVLEESWHFHLIGPLFRLRHDAYLMLAMLQNHTAISIE
jgi:hypothetical protein